ncbi:MAG: efflux RND transporter periplasmic adaptor subunit [Rhodovibrionaceae bacterium]
MKRSLIIAVLFALAAVAWILSGVLGSGAEEPNIEKRPAALAEDRAPAQVRVRQQTALPHTTHLLLRGQTQAERSTVLRAETFGRVVEVLVRDGETVEEGQLLIRIADSERTAQLEEAQALLEQRRIELNASSKLSESGYRAETQVAAARAAYRTAQAQVEQAQAAVDRLTLLAPFSGIVDERMVEVGEYLDVGDSVARLLDLDPLIVTAQVSERNVGNLKLGDQATATLITGQKVTGNISHISAAAQEATRTYRIEMEVDNPGSTFPAGMSAELDLPLEKVTAHLISPAILSLREDGAIGVKLVGPNNVVVFHPVEILENTSEGLWVTGLPETVTLITVGQEFVIEGETVQPVDEESVQQQQPELAS